MRYHELKDNNERLFSAVPLIIAFGNDKLKRKLEENGCGINDILSLGAGTFIKKTDIELLNNTLKQMEEEETKFFATDEGLLDALEYELANHEFCITGDVSEALGTLGLDRSDERVQRLLPIAIKQYMVGVD